MKKILIIEDIDWNRDLLVQLLEEDYEIVEATDGRSGLEAARREMPDLILMDISLPEIDGWELAPLIRQTEGVQNVPIIAVTAHAMSGDEARAIEVRCSAYVAKPIDEDELFEKIQQLLGEG
ncbi:MAG: response regulator [bacterium]|nr:response regulator [bacterium]